MTTEPTEPTAAPVPLPPICDPTGFPRDDPAEARRIGEETRETVTAWAEHVSDLEDADAVRRTVSVLAGLAAARDLDQRATLCLVEAQRRAERACGRLLGGTVRTASGATGLHTACAALAALSIPSFERGIGIARAGRLLDVDTILDAAQAGVEDEEAILRFRIEQLAGQGRPSRIIADEIGEQLDTVRAYIERYRIDVPGDRPPPERPDDVGKYLDELVVDLLAIGRRAQVLTPADLATVDTVRLSETVVGIWDGAAPAIRLRADIEKLLRQ